MKKLQASALFLIFNGAIHAQQTTLSAGSDATGPGGTVHYSVGQVVYTTNTSSGGTSMQGVQQAFEILTLGGTGVKEIQLEVSAYPNPATNLLMLKAENHAQQDLVFELTDAAGRIILSNPVKDELTQIQVDQLPSASYFLTVKANGEVLKNFKIIKH